MNCQRRVLYVRKVDVNESGSGQAQCVIGCEARDQQAWGIPAGIFWLRHPRLARPESKTSTMDITPVFHEVLVQHDARPVEPYVFRVEDLDEFLKEAYRIVGHVARSLW